MFSFAPSILPKGVGAFPIILIFTGILGGNGATEVNLLPFHAVCSIFEFAS